MVGARSRVGTYISDGGSDFAHLLDVVVDHPARGVLCNRTKRRSVTWRGSRATSAHYCSSNIATPTGLAHTGAAAARCAAGLIVATRERAIRSRPDGYRRRMSSVRHSARPI